MARSRTYCCRAYAITGDMKDDERIIDKRSTGRKRGRKVLSDLTLSGERDWACTDCGFIPSKTLEETLNFPDRRTGLDCNHINKNIMDCDPANLEWLCRPCHYAKDRSTTKGVSSVDVNEEMGYGEYY